MCLRHVNALTSAISMLCSSIIVWPNQCKKNFEFWNGHFFIIIIISLFPIYLGSTFWVLPFHSILSNSIFWVLPFHAILSISISSITQNSIVPFFYTLNHIFKGFPILLAIPHLLILDGKPKVQCACLGMSLIILGDLIHLL